MNGAICPRCGSSIEGGPRVGRDITIGSRAASKVETLAEQFRMEPGNIVEELLAMAFDDPAIFSLWLEGQRFALPRK